MSTLWLSSLHQLFMVRLDMKRSPPKLNTLYDYDWRLWCFGRNPTTGLFQLLYVQTVFNLLPYLYLNP